MNLNLESVHNNDFAVIENICTYLFFQKHLYLSNIKFEVNNNRYVFNNSAFKDVQNELYNLRRYKGLKINEVNILSDEVFNKLTIHMLEHSKFKNIYQTDK